MKLSDNKFTSKTPNQGTPETFDRVSRAVLEGIGDADRWASTQLLNSLTKEPQKTEEGVSEIEINMSRESVRNAVRKTVLRKRADLLQVGSNVEGYDRYHGTLSFNVDLGVPTKEQVQEWVDRNSDKKVAVLSVN